MSRKFKLIKDYYYENEKIFEKGTITIEPGVTVLVGCNGAGKTTLLKQIESNLEKEDIPCLHFDNLHDGGSNSISKALYEDNFSFVAESWESSEGENIFLNIVNIIERIGNFIRTGEDDSTFNRLAKAFEKTKVNNEEYKKEVSNERWILLDAVDSGLSIDSVVELKEKIFKLILENNFGKDIYIVVSANEYEMCRGENCFDVISGKYISIKSYEKYRNVILKSREKKDKRNKNNEKEPTE